jgi:imidazolonepropionase-like amidohydrolase
VRRFVTAGALVLSLVTDASPVRAQVAVSADLVHTMAGPAIANGVVLVGKDGKIERVGRAADVRVPEGYRQLRARVVTPGLLDAHSVVGLAGHANQPHDQMQVETSAPMQPELRAIDAYNARVFTIIVCRCTRGTRRRRSCPGRR